MIFDALLLVFMSESTILERLPSIFRLISISICFHYISWLRVVFILVKMPPRRRLANEVSVDEVYDRDCMTRLEQQVEALTQQLGAFFGCP